MPPFRRCFLHIGFEKTGSTSIQAFLTGHTEALRRRGYFVPASLSRTDGFCNHMRLTAYALADHKIGGDVHQHYGISESSQIPAFRTETAERLHREIQQAADSRFLVLSNEHLSSRIDQAEEILRLRQLLAELADTVKVIAYLRCQTGLLESVYNEAVKIGFYNLDLVPDFSAPMHQQWVTRRYFTYGEILEPWSEAFGQENVVVRLFEPGALLFGDVVQDFLFTIHIDPSKFTRFPRQNEGLDRSAQLFLQRLNRTLSKLAPPEAMRIRDHLVALLMDKARGRGRRLSAEQASEFMAQFQQDNERVRCRWFPDRPHLFAASGTQGADLADQASEEEVFDVVGMVLLDLFRRRG